MAVPDFQSLMLPLLQVAGDGDLHTISEARPILAEKFGLSQAEQRELLPSGRYPRFANRISWAKAYLQMAGLLSSAKRGEFQITKNGQAVLRAAPEKIDIKFLQKFPEFTESRKGRGKDTCSESNGNATRAELETPEEALEAAHDQIRANLTSELLERTKAVSPAFFEHLVVDLLLKMGYGGSHGDAGKVMGKAGDEGIDGIISEDRLGLDLVYLQAKKWNGAVGRPEIQKFVGALHGKRAKKGVFITTGNFSNDALQYVEHIDPKVVLIDGRRLSELMIDFGVGVSISQTFEVKRVDSDYFEEG